ncbi:hypothetical protein EJB05_13883, partial [Eragrostis curvula]
MAQIGGELAAKRPNLSFSGPDAGEDRLSALPEDILVLILLRLDTISEAARTCVLSHRWRRIWTLLPKLTFNLAPDYRHIPEVLAAPEARSLSSIFVVNQYDAPSSVAAWLPLAARRLSGDLVLRILGVGPEDDEEVVDAVIPLPCFGNATRIHLALGFLALSLPSSGAFTRLTELCLMSVLFLGSCELGDVVSSPRCPRLRNLRVCGSVGLARLDVQSESLLKIDLRHLRLQKINIDAPALKKLILVSCFGRNRPVAVISAPQLVSLRWRNAYDPNYVQLVNLGQLQRLNTYFVLGSKQHYGIHNRDILQLLHRFQGIRTLHIALSYRKAESACPSGCSCDQPTNWKTEELSLNGLQEVKITGLRGAEHEVIFLKLLFNWAVALEKLRVTFDYSISQSKAKELCQKLSCFFKPETCMQFYIYENSDRRSAHLLSLEDEGTGV